MTQVVVQHTVEDFDTWKPVFDEHRAVREKHGATGHSVYRSADDPNNILVINEFPDLDSAKAFSDDPSLKEAMAKAGVTSQPEIQYRELSESVTY